MSQAMNTNIEIDGKTRLYAIVADPIEQVQTPQLLNAYMRERQFNGVLVPMRVRSADLANWFESLRHIQNFAGFIATVPHKQTMAKLCDEVSDAARLVGAVNVVRREPNGRMVGEILDGKGFVAGLHANGIAPQGLRVLLLGAGGAANAIAFALAEEKPAFLGVHNRSEDKARHLIERLHQGHPDLKAEPVSNNPTGYDLIVNATSLGMAASDPLPVDTSALMQGQVVAEIIMKPAMTALLSQAQSKGCKIHFGLPMLRSQVALMANFMGISE